METIKDSPRVAVGMLMRPLCSLMCKNEITFRYTALKASTCPRNYLNTNSQIAQLVELSQSHPGPTSILQMQNKGSAAGQGPKFQFSSSQVNEKPKEMTCDIVGTDAGAKVTSQQFDITKG